VGTPTPNFSALTLCFQLVILFFITFIVAYNLINGTVSALMTTTLASIQTVVLKPNVYYNSYYLFNFNRL
jgi:hypothetical protein